MICQVVGCGQAVHGRGFCSRHYKRWQKRGEAGGAALERRPNGEGTTHSDGYWRLYLPTHPLADGTGTVLRHRLMLFEKLAGRDARCHWCDAPVAWGSTLMTDHLDFDRANDDPANLVPVCASCNSSRQMVRGRKLDEGQVEVIRRLVAEGRTKTEVAAMFSVSDVLIGKIARGKTWGVPAWQRVSPLREEP